VGRGAWIEADVRGGEAGPWAVYLARISEKDSLAVECTPTEVSLVEQRGGRRRVLAEARRESPNRKGSLSVWAREREGVWTVWLGGRRVFSASVTPLEDDARAGFASSAGGAELARLSVTMPRDPAFFDDFMRDGPDDTWLGLSGDWEYAGVRFPERSANPFSLRARFPGREPRDPFLERRTKRATCGIGVNLSAWRGAVDVERITGNGPAAEAGLREHDIILEINGAPMRSAHMFSFHEDLDGPPGSAVTIKYLRLGELRPRTVKLIRRRYGWALEGHGLALRRESPARRGDRSAGGPSSLAVSGKSSWRDYRYEASVMCPGAGGAGLAFAVRDAANYHVFRAVGDGGDSGVAANRLALVRVRDSRETVLAEREWGPRRQSFYRMAVDLDDENIRCFVDGAPALETADADLPAGRVGLWALAGEGAFFDDVAVSTDRASTAPPPDTRAGAIFAREQDMRRWANPSDEWVPDPESDWWWSRFRYPGSVRAAISEKATFRQLDVRMWSGGRRDVRPLSLFRDARTTAGEVGSGIGTVLSDAAGAQGPYVLELDREGVPAVSGPAGAHAEPLSRRERKGDRVAIRGLENLDAPGVVEIAADGVLDRFFRRAPVDWEVVSGRWGVRNKWICDPRFSWYGGHSESLAAIRSKHVCGGDVTLDFYAALVMTMDDPPYERVGDFACTILANGRSLASGYTLVVSGGRNTWSRLYGGGRLLAESRAPGDRLPSNVIDDPSRRELHQRWFRITIERVTVGGARRVRALLDGREVFDVPDTLGVETGRCVIWTQDNGMLVARARIAASVPPTKPDKLAPSRALVRAKVGGLTNHAFGGLWAALHEDGKGPSGAPAVRVTNAKPGGAFAAASVRTCGTGDRVAFDFRAERGAKVDLYLVPMRVRMVPGVVPELGPFRVRLTGPRGERERHPVLAGPLAGADGDWRRIDIDVGRLVEAWSAAREGQTPQIHGRVRPVFCNLEEGDGDDYLPVGFGGNAPGARYWVSGLEIEPAHKGDRSPPRVARILLPGEEGTGPGCVRVVFDDGTGGSGIDTRVVIASLRTTPSGQADNPKGRGPAPILLRAGHPATRFDPWKQELEIDLATAGMPSGPHASIEVGVMRLADRAGNSGRPVSRSWSREGDADTSSPVISSLEFLPAVPGELELDFEPGAATTVALRERAARGSPVMSLDPGTSLDGSTSLRLMAGEIASPFDFTLRRGFADLDPLLRLSFDYRLPAETPLNLIVRGQGRLHGIVFTDSGDPTSRWSRGIRYAGKFMEAIADDTWRHAELDLAATFRRAYPGLAGYPSGGISLADWGWRGLRPGDGCWIDNVRVEGVRRGTDLAATWRAFDLSGVTGGAWALDSSPDTVPPERDSSAVADAAGARIALPEAAHLPDGPAWFHLRLRDAAGNWGPTRHRRVLVDNTPPVVKDVTPSDGARSAAKEATLRFDDFSGVAMSSLRLAVSISPPGEGGGASKRVHSVDRRACRLDRGTDRLVWSARGAGRENELVPGAKVTAELVSAADIVGNAVEKPFLWSWVYDPATDASAPGAPDVRFTSCRPATSYMDGPIFGDTNDFERELGPVERTSGCTVALLPDAARHGRGGARVTVSPDRRGEFVARLRERYWFPDERPNLAFLCRLPEGLENLTLRIDFFRERREIVLLGPGAAEGLAPPDAKGWRRVAVDLGAAVREWGIEFPEVDGEPYRLCGAIHLAGRAAPGTVIDIDDLELAAADWRHSRVEIEPPEDPSGIDGFAVAWDRSPATIPPESITCPLSAGYGGVFALALPPHARKERGLWYLHVRARDGAGNWGGAAHLRVDLLGPSQRPRKTESQMDAD